MGFRSRHSWRIAPGFHFTDYATQWAGRNGSPLALDLLAILAVVLGVLLAFHL
jgi:hypothetical protein